MLGGRAGGMQGYIQKTKVMYGRRTPHERMQIWKTTLYIFL